VGPFVEHGAVVAFDFAVGLGPVGAGAFVLDLLTEGVFEGVGAVAGAVVGHHAFDGDPAGFEVGVGSGPEAGGGFFALIGQDLGVGQPGVVIDGVVQVHVARAPVGLCAGLVAVASSASEDLVASAVGDASLFLDVDVDHLTGPGPFVATDGSAGGPVLPGQLRQPITGEHPVDGGGLDPQPVADPLWTPPAVDAQPDDAAFAFGRQTVRPVVRS